MTIESDWGWKRRCADFMLGEHVQMIKPSNILAAPLEPRKVNE